MKKIGMLLLTAMISVCSCFSVLAGTWRQQSQGWQYDLGEADYAKNGWNWIEGKCYYFNSDGYCLINTTTPDGYQVGADGAWIVDGVVQTQGEQSVSTSGVFQFSPPSDYQFYGQKDMFTMYIHNNNTALIWVYDINLDYDVSELCEKSGEIVDTLLDYIFADELGVYTAKTQCQFESGIWVRYDYNHDPFMNTSGTATIYARIDGSDFDMVVFLGALSGIDTNAVMNSSVK